jgi:hypothetical protein
MPKRVLEAASDSEESEISATDSVDLNNRETKQTNKLQGDIKKLEAAQKKYRSKHRIKHDGIAGKIKRKKKSLEKQTAKLTQKRIEATEKAASSEVIQDLETHVKVRKAVENAYNRQVENHKESKRRKELKRSEKKSEGLELNESLSSDCDLGGCEFDDATIKLALANYEKFHSLAEGSVTHADVKGSSAGILGWSKFVEGDVDPDDL